MSIGRPYIRISPGQGVDARLIRRLIGQARDQLLGRRHLDGRWPDRRLIGIQHDLLWTQRRR
jgi:hypothetical protein